jgi:hypothetical protein
MCKTQSIDTENSFFTANNGDVAFELMELDKQIRVLPQQYRHNILISFLKNHQIQSDWVKANPQLVDFLTGAKKEIAYTEQLFEAFKKHPIYCAALENYIRAKIQ